MDRDVPWLVRIVERGDRYGRNDALEHDQNDPLVEFYDQDGYDPTFAKRGLFAGRYYLSTLLTYPRSSGLDLQVDQPRWKIGPEGMGHVLMFLEKYATVRSA